MKRNGWPPVPSHLLVLVGLVLLPCLALGQTLDAASEEALAATLRTLTDPSARGRALAADPQGSAVARQIQALAGSPALTEELYALAAQIFEDLARGSGGDVSRMSQALERGLSDPAGFAALLSPATQQRLRELSTKISDVQSRRP